MSINRNVLLARRGELHDAADNLTRIAIKAGVDLTPLEKENFDRYLAEIKDIDATIARLDAAAGMTGREMPPAGFVPVSMPGTPAPQNGNGPTIGRDSDGRPVPIFAKGQSVEAHARQHGAQDNGISLGELCKAMALGGGRSEIRAALAEGSDSSGGVTVPTILTTQIIDLMRAKSTVFQAGALTFQLSTGKATTLTALTSDPVATWRAENAAVSTSDATFAPVTLTPKSLAVIVVASQELLEDSINIQDALTMSLTRSFASELDRVALIGAGTATEPKGIKNISGVGSYSMGTNGLALTNFDPFVNALGTLRTANAADPSAIILHPRSDQELNLLKDSQNRPLDPPAVLRNIPRLVTSKLSITETQGSANTASRAFVGDFSELIVGIRHNIVIQILREKYADSGQIGFFAHLRADIAVRHAASFCQVVGIL